MKALILLALVQVSYAALGFDGINSMIPLFTCLSNAGYSFFIARVGRSNGAVDNAGIQNILNAVAAGWTGVDGYIFPDANKDATEQVQNVVSALSSANAQIGTLWMDIEILNWPSDQSANQQFITNMVNTAQASGYTVGIYTNANNWASIVGSDWSGVSTLPLWWARYDGKQDFSDFSPFGGWTQPAIHQYAGDVNGACGVGMDQNWMP